MKIKLICSECSKEEEFKDLQGTDLLHDTLYGPWVQLIAGQEHFLGCSDKCAKKICKRELFSRCKEYDKKCHCEDDYEMFVCVKCHCLLCGTHVHGVGDSDIAFLCTDCLENKEKTFVIYAETRAYVELGRVKAVSQTHAEEIYKAGEGRFKKGPCSKCKSKVLVVSVKKERKSG